MVRTTVRPDKPSISFDIPEKYIGKEIEVIAFEKDEAANVQRPKREIVTFDAVSIDTRGYKFNRDEANE
ncbi:hypothetical protein SAMN04487996_11930 [Dyadobacter soli]|uniref:Uncharacterized protein n=1 Tax=Dyadobacter soli TaxID=659014 RepID=A0A1G7UL11_9BACT|nr:hypothetical protein [Dyadobacter soli]SDG48038.1 hypothetical protein SAMN04487996_11930 [Dyadobacter soli]